MDPGSTLIQDGLPIIHDIMTVVEGMRYRSRFTVPDGTRILGITHHAVRQRIVEGRLKAYQVRVAGIARGYRIKAAATGVTAATKLTL